MYESPLTAYIEHTAMNLANEINKAQEEYVYQRVMNLGIDIDKDELIRALQYDRHQYEKGYADAMKVLDDIKAEIREWYFAADKQYIAQDPCVVDAMVDLFIRTIDKHCGKE